MLYENSRIAIPYYNISYISKREDGSVEVVFKSSQWSESGAGGWINTLTIPVEDAEEFLKAYRKYNEPEKPDYHFEICENTENGIKETFLEFEENMIYDPTWIHELKDGRQLIIGQRKAN